MTETADMIRAGMHPGEATTLDRNDAIKLIREALKKRSGKTWSVCGDRGTAWGWINVMSPPKRRVAHLYDRETDTTTEIPPDDEHGAYYMSEAECRELADLFGLDRPVHYQGLSIPAASDYRRFYVAAARGQVPTDSPQPYWD